MPEVDADKVRDDIQLALRYLDNNEEGNAHAVLCDMLGGLPPPPSWQRRAAERITDWICGCFPDAVGVTIRAKCEHVVTEEHASEPAPSLEAFKKAAQKKLDAVRLEWKLPEPCISTRAARKAIESLSPEEVGGGD